MKILAKSKNTPEANKEDKDTKSGKSVKNAKEAKEVKDSVNSTSDEKNNEAYQIEIIQDELVELLSVEKDKYLRLAAEYDNYRKRSAKEREMIYTDARIDAISKLLPVYDNLERALKMECSDDSYYKGVEMIMTQLTEALYSMGVQEIPAVGEPFDPNRHNAVMKKEDPGLGENIVAEEYQKGFTIGDRIIRFSTVVVAN